MVDYGMVRKGTFLYDSLLHVPVLWWAPGQIASGTKSGRPHAVRRPLPDACGTNRRQEARTGPGVSLAGALLREEPRGSGSSRRRLTATWLPTSSRPTSPWTTRMQLRGTPACRDRRCGQCTEPRCCSPGSGGSTSTKRRRRNCTGLRTHLRRNTGTWPELRSTLLREGTSKNGWPGGGTGSAL